MDIMQVLEDTAFEFSQEKNIAFVNYMIDRNFAISAVSDEFSLTEAAKNILVQEYLERKYPCAKGTF